MDSPRRTYYTKTGVTHRCFHIRDRDDVNAMLGYTFNGHVIHGDFAGLSPEDYKYMTDFIAQRTRSVPEGGCSD
jgi:hypothetical protein